MKLDKKHIKIIGKTAISIIIIGLLYFSVNAYIKKINNDTFEKQDKINNLFHVGKKACTDSEAFSGSEKTSAKPVIYLYPEKTTDVHVQLDYKGKFSITYPDYNYSIKGRDVIANPDGTLINKADDKEYSYLFWEGKYDHRPKDNISQGFVVKGSETKEFLQNKLAEIGMTPKEYNEFIVYWLPLMQDNPYNLIYFAGSDYTDIAPLNITPKPASMLRVMMVRKKLDAPIEIQPQKLESFQRKGFSIVERGGTEIK